MMTVVVWVCGALLSLAAAAAIWRIMRGPSLLDRMLAADVLLVIVGSALLVHAAMTKDLSNIVFVLIMAIAGFLGSVTVARTVAAREQG
ncbi:cation:proton antiporter [Galactobacter valiniphilus]|uniref:Cation:proton antiporter n=1 Tax=Galactobacter valiniphilus TaxID=2676122 RepID=A0A399JBG3_9MICC|nr:monovalent cation/H+ antiporter complex subunit F [Galactobacter valiniphilus]RII41569.1 cation:proton antiporter [Galactobacter valiniphilus]